jgi:hypothetical protein
VSMAKSSLTCCHPVMRSLAETRGDFS